MPRLSAGSLPRNLTTSVASVRVPDVRVVVLVGDLAVVLASGAAALSAASCPRGAASAQARCICRRGIGIAIARARPIAPRTIYDTMINHAMSPSLIYL